NPNPSSDGHVNSIAVRSDGRIFIGGTFVTYDGVNQLRIARLNHDGTRDTTFIGSANSRVSAIVPIPSGGAFLAGGFSSYSGTLTGAITRVLDDGSRDTSFHISSAGLEVRSVQVRPDGRVLAVGRL